MARPFTGELSHIVHAAQHAAVLTRQILREGRSRPSSAESMDLDVDEVVDGARPLLGQMLGEGSVLEITSGGHGAYVRAHPGQIEQVLFNLVVNARDALQGEGTVTIETAKVDRVGVDAEEGASDALSRACSSPCTTREPAWTRRRWRASSSPSSRPSNRGRAAAWASTVARIAKETGAQVEIESAPKRGCSVRLYFPRVDVKRALVRDDEGAWVRPRGTRRSCSWMTTRWSAGPWRSASTSWATRSSPRAAPPRRSRCSPGRTSAWTWC